MGDNTAVVVGHNMVSVPDRVLVGGGTVVAADTVALVGTVVVADTVALVGTVVAADTVALVGTAVAVDTVVLVGTAAVVVCTVAVVGGMAAEGTETLCLTVVVLVVVGVALVGSVPLVEEHPWDSSVYTLGLPLEEGQQTLVVAVVSSG